MAKYDTETIIRRIKDVIVADFNAKITAINTEKNDSIILSAFDTNAIVINMDKKWMNYNPSIMVSIIDNSGTTQGASRSKNLVVNIALLYTNLNMDGEDLEFLMMRYQRCLEEIFEARFNSGLFLGKLTIQSLPVMEYTEDTKTYKLVGIDLITSYA